MTEKEVKQTIKDLDSGDKYQTPEEQEAAYNKLQVSMANDPSLRDEFMNRIRAGRTQRFSQQYGGFINAMLNGAKIGVAAQQIQKANSYLKNTAIPAIVSSPGTSQELKNQLYDAKSNQALRAGIAGNALKTQANLAEAQGRNDAANISGGNSGNYMANVQAARQQKLNALSSLPEQQVAAMNVDNQRADQLAGNIAQNQQTNYGNSLYGSQLALQQYQQQMAAAGALGSIGHTNLWNTLNQVPQNVISMASQFGGKVPPAYAAYVENLNRTPTSPPTPATNPYPVSSYVPGASIPQNANVTSQPDYEKYQNN